MSPLLPRRHRGGEVSVNGVSCHVGPRRGAEWLAATLVPRCRLQRLVGAATLAVALAVQAPTPAAAAPGDREGPRVLLVTAHPDDDALFGGTVYKISHRLAGKVDLALITNGEGGYKYSVLAEPIYHLELTDEAIGRQYLPGIRKRELMAGGAIVGIRNYFFLDQPDHGFTTSWDDVRRGWDVAAVKGRLAAVLDAGHYDFVFVMLPTAATHGAHQGAALLALEVVAQEGAASRPLVLGATGYKKPHPQRPNFTGRPEHPLTKIKAGAPIFEFDRTQKFGYRDELDYNIVVNWQIAEHKSQGAMQHNMNGLDVEQFFYFDLNRDAGIAAARALFDQLRAPGP
jgi:LmbE family N-acetylglucosaminyl deacetylase